MRKYPSTYLYMPFEMIFVYPFITYQAGRVRAGVPTKAMFGSSVSISKCKRGVHCCMICYKDHPYHKCGEKS